MNDEKLNWITRMGGPVLRMGDGYRLAELSEWMCFESDEDRIHHHADWTEPATGHTGTLMVDLAPGVEPGFRWDACFMYRVGSEGSPDYKVFIPVRGAGNAATFQEAIEAGLAWRPVVTRLEGGASFWFEPALKYASILGFPAGELSANFRDDGWEWHLRLRALEEALSSGVGGNFGRWGLLGRAETPEEVLRGARLSLAAFKGVLAAFVLGGEE